MDRLNAAMAADPELLRRFSELTRDEVLLHQVHRVFEAKSVPFRLPEGRRRSHPGRQFLAIAATVILIVGLGLLYFNRGGAANGPSASELADVREVFAVEGSAVEAINGGEPRRLTSTSSLRIGDRVTVPEGCRLSISYRSDPTLLEFDGGSEFELLDGKGAKHLRLQRGDLRAEVAKQSGDKPMKVITASSEMIVLGTVFEVSDKASTRLAVVSGQVRMNSLKSEASMLVNGGHFAVVNDRFVEGPRLFEEKQYTAVRGETLNQVHSRRGRYIQIDPVGNKRGLLEFNLDDADYGSRLFDATLRLRVMPSGASERGGRGTVRLFKADEVVEDDLKRIKRGAPRQLATYSGEVSAGMDLCFELDASHLRSGNNKFLITLDRGGNDFWFSANRKEYPPRLELKLQQ
jgi:hypothetical protein